MELCREHESIEINGILVCRNCGFVIGNIQVNQKSTVSKEGISNSGYGIVEDVSGLRLSDHKEKKLLGFRKEISELSFISKKLRKEIIRYTGIIASNGSIGKNHCPYLVAICLNHIFKFDKFKSKYIFDSEIYNRLKITNKKKYNKLYKRYSKILRNSYGDDLISNIPTISEIATTYLKRICPDILIHISEEDIDLVVNFIFNMVRNNGKYIRQDLIVIYSIKIILETLENVEFNLELFNEISENIYPEKNIIKKVNDVVLQEIGKSDFYSDLGSFNIKCLNYIISNDLNANTKISEIKIEDGVITFK